MTKAFDPSKPVQTRDGRPARILATDLHKMGYPVVAAILCDDEESAVEYTGEGRFNCNEESDCDLVNIPVRREGWVNIFPGRRSAGMECGTVHPTEADAKACARLVDAIATVRIEWDEPA